MAGKKFRKKRIYKIRKTGIPRTLAEDVTYRKCEYYTSVYAPINNNFVIFEENSLSYLNLGSDILNGSASFLDARNNYSRFKVYGLSIDVWNHTDDSQLANLGGAYPLVAFSFIPGERNSSKGSQPAYDDKNVTLCKQSHVRKFWKFPSGAIAGAYGGVGIWSDPQQYVNMNGSLHVYRCHPLILFSQTVNILAVKVTAYVAFSGLMK